MTLRTVDNIPANYVSNTLHVLINDITIPIPVGDLTLDQEIDSARDAIVTLYNEMGGTVFARLAQTGHTMKFIDVAAPAPQFPTREETFDFNFNPATSGLPSEVAIVSSYEAVKTSGTAQASRRNRVYLGPIAASAIDPTTGRVLDSVRTNIALAFNDFADRTDTFLEGWNWVVYSPTLDAYAAVSNGWVDNAFDTQRRRGVKSSNRSIWVK